MLTYLFSVQYPEFDFKKAALNYKLPPRVPADKVITYDDGVPRSGFSGDGEWLFHHIPALNPQNTIVSVSSSCFFFNFLILFAGTC